MTTPVVTADHIRRLANCIGHYSEPVVLAVDSNETIDVMPESTAKTRGDTAIYSTNELIDMFDVEESGDELSASDIALCVETLNADLATP